MHTPRITAVAALLALCGATLAAPPNHAKHAAAARPGGGGSGGGTDMLPFTDNFDTYTAGSAVSSNGTWSIWAPGSPDGTIDTATAASAPNSFKTNTNSDNVQMGDITTGRWRLTAMTYMPTVNGGGNGFIIGLNTYAQPAGPYHWSMDIEWSAGNVFCFDFAGSPTTPIIYDQWVPFRCEIDLGTDTYSAWYNNVQIVTNRGWSTGYSSTGGVVRIQCFDFFSENTSDLRYDNVAFAALGSPCYANCDGSTGAGFLNINDFVCFQSAFAAGSTYANCDGSTGPGNLNINDFVCFQSAFAAGCSAP